MKKSIISLILILSMVFLVFAGCESGSHKESPKDTTPSQATNTSPTGDDVVTTEPENNPSIVPTEPIASLSKAEECVKQFIVSLQNEDYATALGYLNIDDLTFISAEDLQWYIPRSQYSDVAGTLAEDIEISSDGGKVVCNVKVSIGYINCSVQAVLNDNNEWKVNFNEFVIKDWEIQIPGNIPAYVNGIELTKNYKVSTAELQDHYVIPAIANKTATISLKGTVFGDMDKAVLPPANGGLTKVWFALSEDTMAPVYEGLRTLLNTIHEDYENGATSADFVKYFSDTADPQLAESLYSLIDECYTWNSTLNPTNIRYSIIQGRDDVDNVDIFAAKLRTGDIIILNLNVEKTWQTTKYGIKNESTRIQGSVTIQYVDGEFYLVDVPVDSFFSGRNSMTNRW